jgi:hypothetical protein
MFRKIGVSKAINESGVVVNTGYSQREEISCEIAGREYVMCAAFGHSERTENVMAFYIGIITAREKTGNTIMNVPLPLPLQKEIQQYVTEGLTALGYEACWL